MSMSYPPHTIYTGTVEGVAATSTTYDPGVAVHGPFPPLTSRSKRARDVALEFPSFDRIQLALEQGSINGLNTPYQTPPPSVEIIPSHQIQNIPPTCFRSSIWLISIFSFSLWDMEGIQILLQGEPRRRPTHIVAWKEVDIDEMVIRWGLWYQRMRTRGTMLSSCLSQDQQVGRLGHALQWWIIGVVTGRCFHRVCDRLLLICVDSLDMVDRHSMMQRRLDGIPLEDQHLQCLQKWKQVTSWFLSEVDQSILFIKDINVDTTPFWSHCSLIDPHLKRLERAAAILNATQHPYQIAADMCSFLCSRAFRLISALSYIPTIQHGVDLTEARTELNLVLSASGLDAAALQRTLEDDKDTTVEQIAKSVAAVEGQMLARCIIEVLGDIEHPAYGVTSWGIAAIVGSYIGQTNASLAREHQKTITTTTASI